MTDLEFALEYRRLMLLLQKGIFLCGSYETTSAPEICRIAEKHRAFHDTAPIEIRSLAKLLIVKGVITEDEYRTAVLAGMRQQITDYETALSAAAGTPITLTL